MPAEPAFVIVGASLAGAKAAETLREEGFAGPVVLIGDEQQRPYERPPLSKGFLLGRDELSSVYVREAGMPSTTSTCGSAWPSVPSTGPPGG